MNLSRSQRRAARNAAKGKPAKAAPDATVYRTPNGKRVTRGAGGKGWPDVITGIPGEFPDRVLVMGVRDGRRGYIDPALLTPET